MQISAQKEVKHKSDSRKQKQQQKPCPDAPRVAPSEKYDDDRKDQIPEHYAAKNYRADPPNSIHSFPSSLSRRHALPDRMPQIPQFLHKMHNLPHLTLFHYLHFLLLISGNMC